MTNSTRPNGAIALLSAGFLLAACAKGSDSAPPGAVAGMAGAGQDADPGDVTSNGGGGGVDPDSSAAGASAGGSSAGHGGTGGAGEGGYGGGTGTASCAAGLISSVQEIASGIHPNQKQLHIQNAIATTPKVLVYSNQTAQVCVWGVFVNDPQGPHGLLITARGDDMTSQGQCPSGTDVIPIGTQAGDVLSITGSMDRFPVSTCGGATTPQIQVEACVVTRTGTGPAPEPVVVADTFGLAAGAEDYQGLLVKIEGVTAELWPGATTLGPEGEIKLVGSGLEIHTTLYRRQSGVPQIDPNQHFNSIVGVSHLDWCTWSLQPRNKCADLDPPSKDCP